MVEKWRLVQILYEGLDVTRTTVESMCNGTFIDKSANEAWTFLIEVAENTQQWESIHEPKKTTHVANVHRIESDFEGNAKIAFFGYESGNARAAEECENYCPYSR